MIKINTSDLEWTIEAIDCYNRKCKCKGCKLNDILETQCKMKYTIIELVKQIGTPTVEEYNEKLKYGAYERKYKQ